MKSQIITFVALLILSTACHQTAPTGMSSKDTMLPAPRMMESSESPPPPAPSESVGRPESYAGITENPFFTTNEEALSTFAIDVDAASYSNVRRFLREESLPPADAVRTEEMINYFNYTHPAPPADATHPFAVHTELASCPWNNDHQLMMVGMKGQEIPKENLPPANLIFLLDVSGSMTGPDRLGLLVQGLKMLTNNLREEDRVAIVTYAGADQLVLESTSGADQAKIKDALANLSAGGSTAGAAGIRTAYEQAQAHFIEGGNNRVILATDGDFNVGISDLDDLQELIEEKRQTGVFLSVLGFGRGNLQDDTMELLANKGNGNYYYIDQLSEARKVLVNEFGGTLFTIAKDVKIQMEFNPDYVAQYRLIGYENRVMDNEDFRNDAKDAGELGAGHTVTALYEIVPAATAPGTDLAAVVRLRYKHPAGSTAQELAQNVGTNASDIGQSSLNLRWAAAVSEFALLLRNSEYKGSATYEHCRNLALTARGPDRYGYRQEMISLINNAEALDKRQTLETMTEEER